MRCLIPVVIGMFLVTVLTPTAVLSIQNDDESSAKERTMKDRLLVAAIDFGTTFSGYAFSSRADFKEDPLKIMTNNWKADATNAVSPKAPSCILFDTDQNFHSFGFEAEDMYAELAAEENHYEWFYFKRFKMLLHEHKKLTRDIQLKDDKGLSMPAMKVFTESIRYLKDHLIKNTRRENDADLQFEEIHWVITVPGIWEDSAKQFMREAAIKADYLRLFRDFEIKKKTLGSEQTAGQNITVTIPLAVHHIYQRLNGKNFSLSLMKNQRLKDKIEFYGERLRVQLRQVESFEETCSTILNHLKNIFSKPEVSGIDTILMVGEFSESKMLQQSIKGSFPNISVTIPEDAGLAVLKGAVIFGHNPRAIISRVAKHTYGVETYQLFKKGVHPNSKKVVLDGKEYCQGVFDKHVSVDQEVAVGQSFGEKTYTLSTKSGTNVTLNIYTSDMTNPVYIDDRGCSYLGHLDVDLSDIMNPDESKIIVRMIYGDTELFAETKIAKSRRVHVSSLDFLCKSVL